MRETSPLMEVALVTAPLPSTRPELVGGVPQYLTTLPIGVGARTQSCSYCTKTRKRCTFRWLQSQLQSRNSGSRSVPGADRRTPSGVRQTHSLPRRPLTTQQRNVRAPPLSSLHDISPHDIPPSWDPLVPDFDVPVLPDAPFNNAFPQGAELGAGGLGAAFAGEHSDGATGDSRYLGKTYVGSVAYPVSHHDPSEHGLTDTLDADWGHVYPNSTALGPVYSSQYSTAGCSDLLPVNPRRQSYYSQASFTPTPSLSLFSAEQSMIDRSNNSAISGNLLRIYHDVVEYSLACWLTENTCPYKIRRYNIGTSPGLLQAPGQGPAEDSVKPASQKGDSSWANRIYSRVIKLDKAAQSAKIIRLTRAEDRAASKALRLAIMAFATQWAQKSQRAEEQYEDGGGGDDDDDLGAGLAEEFDRTIQRSLWDQALRALQSCADLETFRVVCAEVIFSWTQKPWDEDDIPLERGGGAGDAATIRASLASQMQDIISKDGLPVFLERAARKMRALRFKVDAHDAGLDVNGGGTNAQNPQDAHTLDSEDRGTVGLLYWLTVMADTISSSMHERPVVLSDEDSQHDDLRAATPGAHQRWGLDLFIQDNPTNPLQSVRWPCSHDDAAWAVQKSVSVKVLLWRHVSYLQNSLRARSRGQAVEEIVHSAMLVYRYWNATYGVFFRDLVENYDAVPPRVRGWFVCIHAHWHLAALMLADLIEFVDESGLGVPGASQERVRSKMSEGIRDRSANELAELSRVSTPARPDGSGDSPAPQMPDFHFAINAGTILTEPWTIILIRAYAKAYVIHFGKADELWRRDRAVLGRKGEACEESLRRCEDCIRALWFLGKKSDISRGLAKALSRALKAFEECVSKEAVQNPYDSSAVEDLLSVHGMAGTALMV